MDTWLSRSQASTVGRVGQILRRVIHAGDRLLVKTVAVRGEGVAELISAVADHRRHLETTCELEQRNRASLVGEVERVVRHRLMERLVAQIDQDRLADVLAAVVARRTDPHTAAEQLLGVSVSLH